jgi:hypothetical protein
LKEFLSGFSASYASFSSRNKSTTVEAALKSIEQISWSTMSQSQVNRRRQLYVRQALRLVEATLNVLGDALS